MVLFRNIFDILKTLTAWLVGFVSAGVCSHNRFRMFFIRFRVAPGGEGSGGSSDFVSPFGGGTRMPLTTATAGTRG